MMALLGAGGTVGVAGCLGDDDGNGGNGGGDGDDGNGGGDDTDTPTDGNGGNGDEDPNQELPDVELVDEDGNQVELTLYFNSGSPNQENMAAQIASDLENVGISLEQNGEPNLLAEHFNSEPAEGEDSEDFEYGPTGRNAGPPDRTVTVSDWDILIGVAANSYPRTPGDTSAFWLADSPTNAYGYVPESVDMAERYSEFRSETDTAQRQEILNDIMGTLTEELPANFLTQSLEHVGFREDINTEPEYNQYGNDLWWITRYRNDQTVGGNYLQLTTAQFGNIVVPEIDDVPSGNRYDLIADGAYAIDTDDEIVPLWLDIEDSGDAQTYVCTLRDNLEWGTDADGNSYGQMTAEDWVYQIEYVHGVADDNVWNEDLPPSAAIDDFSVIENVEETGELEFQLELASPDPSFPLRSIMWGELCLPMDLYETYAPDAEAFRQADELQEFTWTGNLGPYTFQSRTPGVAGNFVVERNDSYYMREHTDDSNVQVMDDAWADAPYFETNEYDVNEEQSTIQERFRSGEGDTMGLPTDFIEEVEQAIDDARVEAQQDPFISMMFYNMRSNGHDVVRTIEGRQALSAVIDKNVIAEDILRGYAEPAVTFHPTWGEWYDESAVTVRGVDVTEEDISEARDLLDSLDGYSIEEV